MSITSLRTAKLFQSTLPARGSDYVFPAPLCPPTKFQSTLPARGSDSTHGTFILDLRYISIHAPRKGERREERIERLSRYAFQSTLPARGSDCSTPTGGVGKRYFNPRSPQGGATPPGILYTSPRDDIFQSTLPARGSDILRRDKVPPSSHFNPRSPQGGATEIDKWVQKAFKISIHAPRKGERQGGHMIIKGHIDFNPRSPQGGATNLDSGERCDCEFQSTLPARGSDRSWTRWRTIVNDFNPRSPQGGATAEKCIYMQHFREFAEYYPLRRGDARCIAPQDCIIQAFFGAKEQRFYVRLYFALKNKGIRG